MSKRETKTLAAGLYIPVARIEHYIRNSTTRDRVSYATATAVSAVVGHVVEVFMDLAIEAMVAMKKQRIATVHLLHALAAEPNLSAVIPMSSIGTGTVPHEIPEILDENGEPVKKKKRGLKRRRSAPRRKSHRRSASRRKSAKRSASRRKSAKRSASRRKSAKRSASRRKSHRRSASMSRSIHRLVRHISASRGRSPAMKKARREAIRVIEAISRKRSAGKFYSRNKKIASKQRLMDKIVDTISRSRSRSLKRQHGIRDMIALSRSISRAHSHRRKTRGGRPARR